MKTRNPKQSKRLQKTRDTQKLETLVLGRQVDYQFDYNPRLLQKIENQFPQKIAWHTFICTEFTSVCPKTGQPDFAKIFIQYVPKKFLVESKSLKLYLFSFRNHGAFHEDCVQLINNDLFELLQPWYIEVIGEFTPRGGIAIYPFTQNFHRSWRKFAQRRLLAYSPGRYTINLARLY